MWTFVLAVTCFCSLGGRPHQPIVIGPFTTFAACEAVREAVAPSAPPCHWRRP